MKKKSGTRWPADLMNSNFSSDRNILCTTIRDRLNMTKSFSENDLYLSYI